MNIKPINYEIEFAPDLKKFTFTGKEVITIECKSLTNKIALNCAEINVKSCNVKTTKKKINSKISIDERKESLEISLKEKIKGQVQINLEFQGSLNDRLLGFYRSQYRQGKKTKFLATTQFEAADARRAFPCWDEPEAKATFDISILADSQFTAISNMPVKSRKKIGKKDTLQI